MNRYLFEKANFLLNEAELLSETDYSVSFKIGKYHVQLKYKNHRLVALCECKAGSLMQPCSHIICALIKLTKSER